MQQGAFVRALVREHAKIKRHSNALIDDGVTVDIRGNIHRIEYVLLVEVFVAMVAGAQEQCRQLKRRRGVSEGAAW